jgi:hypothetical protein
MNSDIKEHDEHAAPHGLSSTEGVSLNDLLGFSDFELLNLAAKSIGGKYHGFTDSITFDGGIIYEQWNPMDDDGDALRLAVRLGLDILTCGRKGPYETEIQIGGAVPSTTFMPCAVDKRLEATRKAIVVAAARTFRART